MTLRLIVFAALLSAIAFSQPANQPPKSGVDFYSIPREEELGRTIGKNLLSTLTIINEPEVSRIVATLAANAGGPFEYQVFVYDDARTSIAPPALSFPLDPVGLAVEPLTIAGGWIFVPYSLVQRTGTGPQLAAILAHSMAHVAGRHATRLATKGDLLQMGLEGLPERVPAIVPVSLTQSLPLAFLTFARTFELQADALAVATLTASAYDPHTLIDYIRMLPAEPSRMFTSMPKPASRISRIEAALTSTPTPAHPAPLP